MQAICAKPLFTLVFASDCEGNFRGRGHEANFGNWHFPRNLFRPRRVDFGARNLAIS